MDRMQVVRALFDSTSKNADAEVKRQCELILAQWRSHDSFVALMLELAAQSSQPVKLREAAAHQVKLALLADIKQGAVPQSAAASASVSAKDTAAVERPMKPPTTDWLATIIGDEKFKGRQMGAGVILDTIDLLAGRCAYKHAECPVVTLSFDKVDLKYPLMNGDLIRVEGRVVRVGRSSIVVRVLCHRHDDYSNSFVLTHKALVTMVAVKEDGRPNKNIPGLRHETDEDLQLMKEAEQHLKLGREWEIAQAKVVQRIDLGEQAKQPHEQPQQPRSQDHAAEKKDTNEEEQQTGPLTAAMLEASPENQGKDVYATIKSTEVAIRRQFLPRHRNFGKAIFGGDILLEAHKVVMYCARLFARNSHVMALSMDRVFFKLPVTPRDLVEMVARVVYVRKYTFVVEVAVNIHPFMSNKPRLSHTGRCNFLQIMN